MYDYNNKGNENQVKETISTYSQNLLLCNGDSEHIFMIVSQSLMRNRMTHRFKILWHKILITKRKKNFTVRNSDTTFIK